VISYVVTATGVRAARRYFTAEEFDAVGPAAWAAQR
jgi:hypothetical protein